MQFMKAAQWGLAVIAFLCVSEITAVPTASPTPCPPTKKPTAKPTALKTKTPTSVPTPVPTVKPTSVFCTSTRCKNGGSCSIGDTSCTCLNGFSGKTCATTPSPTPVPTQVPTTPSPTAAPTKLFCTPTKCKNGGTCASGDTTCTCARGYSGKTCTDKVPLVCTKDLPCTGTYSGFTADCSGFYCPAGGCTGACGGATFDNSIVHCSDSGCWKSTFTGGSVVTLDAGVLAGGTIFEGAYAGWDAHFTDSTVYCNWTYACYFATFSGCTVNCLGYQGCAGAAFTDTNVHCISTYSSSCTTASFGQGTVVECQSNNAVCEDATSSGNACCYGDTCYAISPVPPVCPAV